MKISKKNMKIEKWVSMYIKKRRQSGIVPLFCIENECYKLIRYGRKINDRGCLNCKNFSFRKRPLISKD